LLYYLIHFLCM